jgi:hypothetical protein
MFGAQQYLLLVKKKKKRGFASSFPSLLEKNYFYAKFVVINFQYYCKNKSVAQWNQIN